MPEIKNKLITIMGFEFKNNRYSITDQDNQKFGFFTTKKDGEDTQVYAQWKDMQLGQGKSVRIGYVEEKFYSDKAKRDIYVKKIINFQESSQPSAETPPQVQDDYGRRLAIHGMVNARLVNHKIVEVIEEIGQLFQLEDEISHALNGKSVEEIGNEIEVEEPPYEDDLPPFSN